MAINERLIDTEVAAAGNGGGGNGGGGTGNQEEGLILHLDANDVDSYDGDGSEWVDITNHEYTPATNVSEHFNTIIWDGDGSTDRDITGVGFAPDLVWIKRYAPSYGGLRDHRLFDTLRGAGKVIYSSGTFAETTPTNELNGFLPDGFNVGNSDAVNANIYGVEKYVAWCFKAGGAPTATNTLTNGTMSDNSVSIDGELKTSYSITDATLYPKKISANTKLGFSTVLFTGTGDSNNKVPHGLGVAPELIIYKNIDAAKSWVVGTDGIGWSNTLKLDDTTALGDRAYFDDVTPTSNVFEIYNGQASTANDSGSDFIAYCFASKRGVSKVGSFTGTGAAGNKVYTGFEPAFILTKRSSSSGAGWTIIDNKRSTDSDKNDYLYANTSGAEATSSSGITFNRDGFTFNGSSFNTSGQQHIYYAVAKSTNETDLIDDTDLELHLDADSFPEKGESGYSNTPSTWTALTGSNGTISGAVFDSELGNWLDFDGSNDSVSVPHDVAFNSSTDISFEVWVNRDGTTEDTIISKGTGGSTNYFFIYNPSNGYYYYNYVSGGGVKTGTSGLSTGKWEHVVLSIDGSGNKKIYVNGEDKSTAIGSVGTTDTTDTGALNIGGANGYTATALAGFGGKIGQFRIYGSALTQDQVRQNFNFTKNDYPNGNNFTKSGDVSWNSNGYFDFDGVNDRFNAISFKGRPIQSWALWINPDSVSTRYTILTTYPTGTIGKGGMYIELRDDAKIEAGLRTESGSTSSVNSTTTLSANQWQHIVVTSDGTDLTIYINSVERGSTSASVTTFQDSLIAPLGIGYEIRNVRNYFNGQMSDIKVYDKALTQGEIDAQFAIKQTDIG